ncbi:MAG: DpnII family type II restriction endonuclease [Minisyncoccia bacterium]
MKNNIEDNIERRFNRIRQNNTYFYHNKDFENKNEKDIKMMTNLLWQLKESINNNGLTVKTISNWLKTHRNGLDAILTLIGLSQETFLRLISFIRIINDKDLNNLVNRDSWPAEKKKFHEWSINKIKNLVQSNKKFRDGIVKLFFWGSTMEAIKNNLPLFEHSKLSIKKFEYDTYALLDTIVRYKYKGALAANSENNPENLIKKILKKNHISFTKGKLKNVNRLMDFIIPSKKDPKIIIECSYVVTTSSGQGDKAKTEQSIYKSIKKYYPNSKFFGFIDGIGWLVREGDLRRMVSAYDDVFTFKKSELNRFEKILKETILQGG